MAAIMLEHRKFRAVLQTVPPDRYQASLVQSGSPTQLTLKKLWRWVAHGFAHGFLIALFCLYFFESGSETRGQETVMKQIGVKDQSTLAFNIVLLVIFVKLGFELENLTLCATNLIAVTIVFNFVLLAMLSGNSFGTLLDPDLAGVSTRSVFNLNAFVLLLGTCLLILFIEYLPIWFRQYRAKLKQNRKARQE